MLAIKDNGIMARPRAPNHDDKRKAILERSAELFAAHGYDRSSLALLARACGMSKALLYHYYVDKSQLLFDIIRSHLQDLLEVTAISSVNCPGTTPRDHLLRLTEALLAAYVSSDHQHHVQINQMHLLPQSEQKVLKDMERALVERFATAIIPCVPLALRCDATIKPLTMSLFAMINWNYLWFRDDGTMSRRDYARLAVTLLVDGAARFDVKERPG